MNQEQQRLNISLDNTTEIVCEKCGSNVFSEGLMLREVSRLLTGASTTGLIPINTFYCVMCGHVNERFLPVQKPQVEEVKSPNTKFKKKPLQIVR